MSGKATELNLRNIEAAVLGLNKAGLSSLSEQNGNYSTKLLTQALRIIDNQLRFDPMSVPLNKLATVTLNNLACSAKKLNRPKAALGFLQRALQIQNDILRDIQCIAATHLNVCATLSCLKLHNEAVRHAQLALNLLAKGKSDDATHQNICMIAHYNYAAQLEYLKQNQQAVEYYEKAARLARLDLPNNYQFAKQCDSAVNRLKESPQHYLSLQRYLSKPLPQRKPHIGVRALPSIKRSPDIEPRYKRSESLANPVKQKQHYRVHRLKTTFADQSRDYPAQSSVS